MRITKDCRGFREYGTVTCSYGTTLRVKESSSAEGPHVWLFVSSDPRRLREPEGEASAHLTRRQAKALVARLQAWLDGK